MYAEDSEIKWLVEMSPTEKEADDVMTEFRPTFSYRQKCDLLLDLFPNIRILGRYDGEGCDKDRTDYETVLSAAVNLKWR